MIMRHLRQNIVLLFAADDRHFSLQFPESRYSW